MISNNDNNLNLSFYRPNPLPPSLAEISHAVSLPLPFPLSLSICIHLHSTATQRHAFLQILQECLGKQEGF